MIAARLFRVPFRLESRCAELGHPLVMPWRYDRESRSMYAYCRCMWRAKWRYDLTWREQLRAVFA